MIIISHLTQQKRKLHGLLQISCKTARPCKNLRKHSTFTLSVVIINQTLEHEKTLNACSHIVWILEGDSLGLIQNLFFIIEDCKIHVVRKVFTTLCATIVVL